MIPDPDLLIRKITADVQLTHNLMTSCMSIPVYSFSLRMRYETPTAMDVHTVLEYIGEWGEYTEIYNRITDFDPSDIHMFLYENDVLLENLQAPGRNSVFVWFDSIAIQEGPNRKTASIKGSRQIDDFPENNILISNFNTIVRQVSEYGKRSYQLALLPIVSVPYPETDPEVFFVNPGDTLSVRDTSGVCRKATLFDSIIDNFTVGAVTLTFPPLTVSISESEV